MKYSLLIFLFVSNVVSAQISWNVDSISRWNDINLPSEVTHSKYNEVWGFVYEGREYAVIGSRAGTYIINISNPERPKLIQFIAGEADQVINRDFHDYNGYLYMVADQGESTLQIADLSYLPDSIHLIYNSNDLFRNCHNIFIDSISGHLYACDVRTSFPTEDFDLQIYDLNNSPIPELLLTYNLDWLESFHDIYVVDDTAWGNNGRTGLLTYDFSDPKKPRVLGNILDYPDKGYNHAGYADEDNAFYYFSDETKGMDLKAVDGRNLNDPQITSLFNSGTEDPGVVAHNLLVSDTILYVSYYHEGLQVYSLSDPAFPKKIAYYQTYNQMTEPDSLGNVYKDFNGYRGVWGVYPYLPSGNILASDREKGLFVFRLKEEVFTPPTRTIFPNPFEGNFFLSYKSDDILTMKITDANGKLVEDALSFSKSDEVTLIEPRVVLSRGIYFLSVQAKTESFTLRIEKM